MKDKERPNPSHLKMVKALACYFNYKFVKFILKNYLKNYLKIFKNQILLF